MSDSYPEAQALGSWLFQRAMTIARAGGNTIREVADALIRAQGLDTAAFEEIKPKERPFKSRALMRGMNGDGCRSRNPSSNMLRIAPILFAFLPCASSERLICPLPWLFRFRAWPLTSSIPRESYFK
jgi:hypothetical protein